MKLFDLFREFEIIPIADGGVTVDVGFRSLTYIEHQQLQAEIEKEREAARKQFDTQESRKELAASFKEHTQAQLIDLVIETERPMANAVSDLAPTPPKMAEGMRTRLLSVPSQAKEQIPHFTVADRDLLDRLIREALEVEEPKNEKGDDDADAVPGEKAVMSQWEITRREGLASSSRDVLVGMLVERQINLAVSSRANLKFAEQALLMQVINPNDRTPMLTLDATSPDYIGNLQPRARQRLVEEWQGFMQRTNEKAIRRHAEDPRFLRSGTSESASPDSPGATTVTPSSSPTPSPSSIASGGG